MGALVVVVGGFVLVGSSVVVVGGSVVVGCSVVVVDGPKVGSPKRVGISVMTVALAGGWTRVVKLPNETSKEVVGPEGRVTGR